MSAGKRILLGAGIVLLALCAVAGGLAAWYWQRPSVRFLSVITGIAEPRGVTRLEEFVTPAGRPVSVMVYRVARPAAKRYFMLIPGLTPEGNRHDKIDRMARAFCYATGITILVPDVAALHGPTLDAGALRREIAGTYLALRDRYPGDYQAFGACFGASALVAAMATVPADRYPKKMLLYGPFMDGRELLTFYNKVNADVDFIVKLGISARMDIFTPAEQALIKKAMTLAGSGTTDRSRIRRIVGERLFNDIAVVRLRQPDLEAVNVDTLFGRGRPVPDCRYFILHSKSDTIIPLREGENLFAYLRRQGAHAQFLGTTLFSHTENRVTVTGMVTEFRYLVAFFDDYFAGD